MQLASGTIVESGGVLSGFDVASGDVLQGGAFESLFGTSYNADIESGATVLVNSLGVLSGATVQSGAEVVLLGGAQAIDISGGGAVVSSSTVVVSGGDVVVVAPVGAVMVGSGATEYVVSGSIAQGAVIASGGVQLVEGGVAEDTVVDSGGTQSASDSVVSGTIISSGGVLVAAGGTEVATTIKSGGELYGSFTSSLDAVISSAGGLFIDYGMTSGTTVSAGGVEDIQEGATALRTDVLPGGTQFLFNAGDNSAGTAIDTSVSSGGQLFDEYITSSAVILSGGVEVVLPGGTATDTNVASGAFLLLDSGMASSTTGGGRVLSGGVVVISANGVESIDPAGAVNLAGGGAEYVFGAGVASGAVIGSGAAQIVLSTASNTIIDGGAQYVSAGVAYNTDIEDGIQVVGPGFVFGASGYVPGGTDMDVTIGASGTLLYAGGALSGGVVFSGAGGALYDNELPLAGPGGFGYTYGSLPVISGFAVGDKLVLGFAITSGTGPVISGGTLTFTDVADGFPQSYSVTFAGDAGDQFAVTSLANGTTEVEVTALCFLAGTMIDTPGGEMPVERLAIGDLVTTHVGPRAVKWLGRRAYGRRFVADKPMAAPVCIAAGALGTDSPRRDLCVSPGHGVLVEGQLVPAWRLINGVSITQPVPVADVFYTHIELQDHAVVYAEGTPAETFLEEALRGRFQNAAEYYALYPGPVADRENCFPRLEEGFLLQSLQQRVAKRAGMSPRGLAGRLTGAVEASGPGWAVGWALDEDDPRQPVCLDVMVHGVPVRRILANRYRPDLRARGLGDGACGFAVELPPPLWGPISLRRSEDHALLAA